MNLLGFEVLRPEDLWGVATGFVLLAVGWWALNMRERNLARWVHARHRENFVPGWSRTRSRLRLFAAVAALICMGFAFVGPVRGYTEREVRRRGLDLVVCVDTSRSMLVGDLRPNRLDRAKREVRGLLDRLRNDRVSLLGFAGGVRDVAPLTHDRAALAGFVDALSPSDNRVSGTDLGLALERALELFDGRNGAHEAIVLLTDGEDHEARGLAVAEEAKRRGIRIYVVGMASAGGGKIPELDEQGKMAFVRDENGEEVISRLDGSSLQRIAKTSGGEYLAAAQSPTPLEELYDKRIAHLEGREFGQQLERVPHDRFQWFLVLALGLVGFELGLRERRTK